MEEPSQTILHCVYNRVGFIIESIHRSTYCKHIFRNRKFARHPRSDLAWVKSQQNRMLVSFVFFSIPLRSAQLLMSIWRGKPSTLHLIKNTADDGMEIYPIWELKNASARPLCSENSLSHRHTPSISHTVRQNTASLGTACKFVLWPSEPCGENRKWQASATVTGAKKLF